MTFKQRFERIACLSTEVVEVLYLLGAQDRIVGVSGFTVYPPEARRDKPHISGYTTATLQRILAVRPDLVLAFSDMQADIVRDLIKAGIEVHVFNQRSLEGMLAMVQVVGALAGESTRALELSDSLAASLRSARERAVAADVLRPKVWFEEWPEPLISGVGWVSELIDAAGGQDCFPELAARPQARDRIVADPLEVVARQPDLILGSWCGRKFRPERVVARPGWRQLPAVRNGFVREIKSADILAPGPTLVSRALGQLQRLVQEWQEGPGRPDCSDPGLTSHPQKLTN
jgi:iron complex transport system substrate-binding protein